MHDDSYVTRRAWLQTSRSGRPDAIDEVADQFERPDTCGADAFWSSVDLRHAASIRAVTASFVSRGIERRAG